MAFRTEYYIVDREALPDVFVKVVEAKRLLLTGQVQTVQEATELLKISRSKYKIRKLLSNVSGIKRQRPFKCNLVLNSWKK